jgi:DNA-binding transcriptional LysR family regulator
MSATLDIDLLRSFHTIVRFGQFRAASTHLSRSPSTISMHVRRLEELLGGQLFERDNQAVTLTPVGRRFCVQTSGYLQMHDRLLAGFREEGITSGKVRLGVSEEYGDVLFRGLLPPLAAEYPGIELEVVTGYSGSLASLLSRGKLDIALLVDLLDIERNTDPLSQDLGLTQPVWVSAHSYRIDAENEIPLALHGEGCPYRAAAIDALTKLGTQWRPMVISATPNALKLAIKAGVAVGILDRGQVDAGMKLLQPSDGFPALPAYSVRLKFSSQQVSEACSAVARLVSSCFIGAEHVEAGSLTKKVS